ncbi:MAG: hypothetical protein K6F57_00720 [Candidatus Saccharibacteria bacterium]|nr:hypothetical protein [Candidatus Saccharibacteria bacterium]
MLANSILRNNKRTSKARRFGRRDTRRRFLIIGLPILLVGILAGSHFLNSFAAENVNANFKIDLTRINDAFLQSIYDNYEGASYYYYTNKPLIRINSVFYKYDDLYDWGTSTYTDITKNFGHSGNSSTISIQPGKYYVVNSAFIATRAGNTIDLALDSAYFKFLDVDDHEIEVENGYPKNFSNHTTYGTVVEVKADGSVVTEDGSEYAVKMMKNDYTANKPYVDIYLRALEGAQIPENEKLILQLYSISNPNNYDTANKIASAIVDINGAGKYRATFSDLNIDFPELTTPRYESTKSYCVSYAVINEQGAIDPYWRNHDCVRDGTDSYVYHYSGGYYNYHYNTENLNTIREAKYENRRRNLVIGENYIGGVFGNNLDFLVIESAYTKVDAPEDYKISEASSDPTSNNSFHPIQSVNDISDGSRYIIAAKNHANGKYYALSADGKTNTTLLPDLTDETINDYRISDHDLTKGSYVMTARSSNVDGEVATTKFLSNIDSDTGRKLTFKLGSDAWPDKRIFDNLGGANFTVEKDQFNEGTFRIYKRTGDLVLNDIFGRTFFASTTNPKWPNDSESRYDWFGLEYFIQRSNGANTFTRYYQPSNRFTEQELYPNDFATSDYVASCKKFISSMGANGEACNIDAYHADYWNSQEYYNKWLETVRSSLYILTNEPIRDTAPQKQDVRVTYFPVQDASTEYKETWGDYTYDGYSTNFLLAYKDTNNKLHLLSEVETEEGDPHTIYPGSDATFNSNGSITTYVGNAFTFSVNDDIKAESDGQLKLHALKQYDEYTTNPYITIDSDDDGNFITYAKSRKEMSFYFNDDNTLNLRASKSDRWIGWDDEKGFVSVATRDQAVKFSVYKANNNSYQIIYKNTGYGDQDGYSYVSNYIPEKGTTIARSQLTRLYNTLGKEVRTLEEGNNGIAHPFGYYIFAGWTQNKNKSGLVTENFENIYDAKNGLSEDFVDAHELVSNTDWADLGSLQFEQPEPYPCSWDPDYMCQDSPTITLYPVYVNFPTQNPAYVKNNAGENLIAAADWKDFQHTDDIFSAMVDQDERWQGSINLEVYIDGKKQNDTQKLYYNYHNDNSADILLKFVDDTKLDLDCPANAFPDGVPDGYDIAAICEAYGKYVYVLDDSILPATSQDGKYTIDAVVAEQAGSEDGLKYAYNWVDEKGARLDNVKGGSTIKVYLSNKYQVKYYLDDEQLTDDAHTDTNYYASGATMRAIEAEQAVLNMNANISDEELQGLMDKNITEVGNSDVFKPANPKRFTFEAYKYVVHERDNKFTAAAAPEIPQDKRFKVARWQIKDDAGNIVAEVSPEELAAISEQEGGLEQYFDALTQYAYTDDGDNVNTFHLYLYTEDATEDEQPASPENKPKETPNPEQTSNPLTSPGAIAIYFMITGASVAALGLMTYKKSH